MTRIAASSRLASKPGALPSGPRGFDYGPPGKMIAPGAAGASAALVSRSMDRSTEAAGVIRAAGGEAGAYPAAAAISANHACVNIRSEQTGFNTGAGIPIDSAWMAR